MFPLLSIGYPNTLAACAVCVRVTLITSWINDNFTNLYYNALFRPATTTLCVRLTRRRGRRQKTIAVSILKSIDSISNKFDRADHSKYLTQYATPPPLKVSSFNKTKCNSYVHKSQKCMKSQNVCLPNTIISYRLCKKKDLLTLITYLSLLFDGQDA